LRTNYRAVTLIAHIELYSLLFLIAIFKNYTNIFLKQGLQ